MCGRYHIDDEVGQAIQKLVREIDEAYSKGFPAGDIHPTETAPILMAGTGEAGLRAEPCFWGFPGFDKRGVIFNARSETALEKKLFSASVLQRRCVIPARKFYEWDKSKNKVAFVRDDGPVIYMAGFYDVRDGQNRFVILTTGANGSMAPVHDRMPLLLEPDRLEAWVRDSESTPAFLKSVPAELKKEYDFYQEQFPFLQL